MLLSIFFSVSLLGAIIVVLYPLSKGQARHNILDFFTSSSSMSNRLFFIIFTIIMIMLSITFHYIKIKPQQELKVSTYCCLARAVHEC